MLLEVRVGMNPTEEELLERSVSLGAGPALFLIWMLNTQACSAATSELHTFVGHIRTSIKIFNMMLKHLLMYVYI